ncbi:MAG: hydantoinase B/oxoprolinase family protein [Longimicrobiales bacterium]
MPDPVKLEIYKNLFHATAEEMGAALRRTAFSPNIKERRDYSCALFDAAGSVVAQGDHMPVHLGAMPRSVAAALAQCAPLAPGDVVALNDPFAGGTHLPDITLVSAVHDDTGVLAYLAARAHHADVGGMAAGSMPLAREIFQEGLRIPPVRLVRAGERVADVWRVLLANVRTPVERAGDLDAQLGALHAGATRLRDVVTRYGGGAVRAAMHALLAYADRLVGAGIARIPDGTYAAEDALEDDGFGSGPVPIRVRIHVHGETMRVDFHGSAPQTPGGVNAVEAITLSATRYVVRCIIEALLGQALPAGGGAMRGVALVVPHASVVAAEPPASVAAGNVETSQRIADVLLLAFSHALPALIPAQSQGTMNNLTIGGIDPRTGTAFAYYETMAGGMGGGPGGRGLSAVHVHMTNSRNTPIEALEHAYPLRVRRYEIRRGTGGTGVHAGGDGVRRDIELLADADVSLLTERRAVAPRGARGGGDAANGQNVRLSAHGDAQPLPAKCTMRGMNGDVFSIRSPGGGGWGTVP